MIERVVFFYTFLLYSAVLGKTILQLEILIELLHSNLKGFFPMLLKEKTDDVRHCFDVVVAFS